MAFKVTYSDPAGQASVQTVEVPGDRFTINESRNQLLIFDGEQQTAAFVNWFSVVPTAK